MSAAPSSRGRLSRPARAVITFVAGVAIAVVTVLSIEGAASAYLLAKDYRATKAPTAYAQPYTEYDTLLGWVNRPSFSSPNAYGRGIGLTTTPERFRGPVSIATSSTPSTRLVCSGDSFTMGVGVADSNTWCTLLQRHFPGLQTVNMGQAAYGLDQALLWYRRDGLRHPHQVQLLGLIDLMFERSLTGRYAGREKPRLVLDDDELATTNVPVPAQTREALRRAFAARTVETLRVMQLVRRMPGNDGRERAAQAVDRQWPLFEKALDDLVALHRERGTQLVMAYYPTIRDVRGTYLDARRRRIAEYAERRAIPFIDLTPNLRALSADSVALLYIARERPIPGVPAEVPGHFSDEGNAWAAGLLAERLAATPAVARLLPAYRP